MTLLDEVGRYLVMFTPGAIAQMAVLAGGLGFILMAAIWGAGGGDDGHA